MKSLCLKTNNIDVLTYLFNELKNSDFEKIFFSLNSFKSYDNIILHFDKSLNNDNVESLLSKLLSIYIIDNYEDNLLHLLLSTNYSYFSKYELSEIIRNYYNILSEEYVFFFNQKFDLIYPKLYSHLISDKNIFLDGFIYFRLKEYLDLLDKLLSKAVTSFLLAQEYIEFTSLLKSYISSQPPTVNLIHLIYSSSESILLDENKEIIMNISDFSNSKFLSDISFSTNDYSLNTLLNLLPKKIYIHLLDESISEFVQTLQIIFGNKVTLCNDCDICRMYSTSKIEKN